MRRRDFFTILGGAAATQVIGSGLVRAGTSSKLIAIVAFIPVSKAVEPYVGFLGQFPQGLQEQGYVLGRDLDVQPSRW